MCEWPTFTEWQQFYLKHTVQGEQYWQLLEDFIIEINVKKEMNGPLQMKMPYFR